MQTRLKRKQTLQQGYSPNTSISRFSLSSTPGRMKRPRSPQNKSNGSKNFKFTRLMTDINQKLLDLYLSESRLTAIIDKLRSVQLLGSKALSDGSISGSFYYEWDSFVSMCKEQINEKYYYRLMELIQEQLKKLSDNLDEIFANGISFSQYKNKIGVFYNQIQEHIGFLSEALEGILQEDLEEAQRLTKLYNFTPEFDSFQLLMKTDYAPFFENCIENRNERTKMIFDCSQCLQKIIECSNHSVVVPRLSNIFIEFIRDVAISLLDLITKPKQKQMISSESSHTRISPTLKQEVADLKKRLEKINTQNNDLLKERYNHSSIRSQQYADSIVSAKQITYALFAENRGDSSNTTVKFDNNNLKIDIEDLSAEIYRSKMHLEELIQERKQILKEDQDKRLLITILNEDTLSNNLEVKMLMEQMNELKYQIKRLKEIKKDNVSPISQANQLKETTDRIQQLVAKNKRISMDRKAFDEYEELYFQSRELQHSYFAVKKSQSDATDPQANYQMQTTLNDIQDQFTNVMLALERINNMKNQKALRSKNKQVSKSRKEIGRIFETINEIMKKDQQFKSNSISIHNQIVRMAILKPRSNNIDKLTKLNINIIHHQDKLETIGNQISEIIDQINPKFSGKPSSIALSRLVKELTGRNKVVESKTRRLSDARSYTPIRRKYSP